MEKIIRVKNLRTYALNLPLEYHGTIGDKRIRPPGTDEPIPSDLRCGKQYPLGENGRNFIRNHKSCRRILGETKHCQRRPLGVKESVLFHKKEIRLQSHWKISV